MRRSRYLWTWQDYALEVIWWLGMAVLVVLAMPVAGVTLKLIWKALMFGWKLV
jgi:hypothetical protein